MKCFHLLLEHGLWKVKWALGCKSAKISIFKIYFVFQLVILRKEIELFLLAFQDVKTFWTIKSYQVHKETSLASRWSMNFLPKGLNLLFVIIVINPCAHLPDFIDIISTSKLNVRKSTKSRFPYHYIRFHRLHHLPLPMTVWTHRDMFHPAPSLYTSC